MNIRNKTKHIIFDLQIKRIQKWNKVQKMLKRDVFYRLSPDFYLYLCSKIP